MWFSHFRALTHFCAMYTVQQTHKPLQIVRIPICAACGTGILLLQGSWAIKQMISACIANRYSYILCNTELGTRHVIHTLVASPALAIHSLSSIFCKQHEITLSLSLHNFFFSFFCFSSIYIYIYILFIYLSIFQFQIPRLAVDCQWVRRTVFSSIYVSIYSIYFLYLDPQDSSRVLVSTVFIFQFIYISIYLSIYL